MISEAPRLKPAIYYFRLLQQIKNINQAMSCHSIINISP